MSPRLPPDASLPPGFPIPLDSGGGGAGVGAEEVGCGGKEESGTRWLLLGSESELAATAERGLEAEKLMCEGSFCRVFRCRRRSDGEGLALKIIELTKASQRFLTRFLPRELAIPRRLEHPNLARTLDSFTVLRKTYVVMELSAGGDLEQHLSAHGALEDRGLPDDLPRSLFRQALRGVEHLHSLGVVHRDLKIENLFLGEGMSLKVGDFGFSREMGEEEVSETFCGSLSYSAPELLQQRAYKGRLTDAYALGVVLFIVLEARVPFDERDRARMLRRQLSLRLPFSRKSKASARSLVSALLHPEPAQRLTVPLALRHAFLTPPAPPQASP